MHLTSLTVRMLAELHFVLRSPLFVGSGRGEALLEPLRLPGGELLIPASSWKGAFRSISERLAKSMRFGSIEGLAVRLYHEDALGGVTYKTSQEFDRVRQDIEAVLEGGRPSIIPEDSEKKLKELLLFMGIREDEIRLGLEPERKDAFLDRAAEAYLSYYCPISRLYGNKWMAGKLRFLDTILDGIRIFAKSCVGIERSTQTKAEHVLFSHLVAEPGCGIELRLLLDNLSQGEADSRLLAATLEFIHKTGLQIGARKSAGYGLLELDGCTVWLAEFKNIKNEYEKVLALVEPWKYAKKLDFADFVKWLRGG